MRTGLFALVSAALIAGCASGGGSSGGALSVSAGGAVDSRSTASPRRCSAADPDRYAWFCIIGQIGYSVLGGFQSDPGPGLR